MSLSRRDFLKTSGALIVTFSLAPESVLAQRLDGASSNQLDGWLAVNGDASKPGGGSWSTLIPSELSPEIRHPLSSGNGLFVFALPSSEQRR